MRLSARRGAARREEKAAREAKLAEENAEYARRVSSTRAKDVKGLDEKTWRPPAVADRRAAEKAERERAIAEENAALARRRSSLHGRDAKALDDVTEAARREVEARRLAEKEAREAKIAEENAVMRQRIAASKRAGRTSRGSARRRWRRGASRRGKAQRKAEQEMILKMENLEFERRLSHQSGRDEKGLSPKTLADRKAVAERSAQRSGRRKSDSRGKTLRSRRT